ncbi:MAG: alpha-D-glucose phosphate-specific phosphoglucomutase [Deltaproteobacteria bacterium]|nr:MAG: alpha-D-glucose phosphate-specific phosphoglucomutase [Deltaproteobacteria bacterium]
MSTKARPGQPAPRELLIDPARLQQEYYRLRPDPAEPGQRVSFGTSGHRGSASARTFNERHILAISQAICDWRQGQGITGPLFLGRDTHALSEPAYQTALEVFAGNGVPLVLQHGDRPVPTPVISHAILAYNRRGRAQADGVVVTPSHNPPEDGGFKYNPPHGGPAETAVTRAIEQLANQYLQAGLAGVRRIGVEQSVADKEVSRQGLCEEYSRDLDTVIDLEVIAAAGVRLGVDPLGGASLSVWQNVAELHRLNIEVVNTRLDPTFSFVPLDHDGRIRMDCSSPYVMSRLVEHREHFDVACGTDPDADRHGIVTRSAGLLPANRYLTAAAWYLFTNRPNWPAGLPLGKTVVTTALLDRLARQLGRQVFEVPVGFKWFAEELLAGRLGFAGEESAGASLLRRDGRVWTTDKDGMVMCLLAAELLARLGRDAGQLADELEQRFGKPSFQRIDLPVSAEQKARLTSLGQAGSEPELAAGEPVEEYLTTAPGNGQPIGGVKVKTASGWFAVRPSGTESACKIYAESFSGERHLQALLDDARKLLDAAVLERPGRD